MHATIRRYDGVDQNRTTELTSKVNETLMPKLNKLPGFKGYYLIDAGNGVFSSLGLFETPEQGMESTKLVTTWIREEKLETILPNEPKITSGKIVARSSDRVLVGRVARPHRIRRRARLAGPSFVPDSRNARCSRTCPAERVLVISPLIRRPVRADPPTAVTVRESA